MGVNALVIENIENEFLSRVAEEAAHQMTHLEAAGFVTANERHVDVRAGVLYVADVTLLLENANRRQNGVVCERRLCGQSVQDLLDGGRMFAPEHFHDP